MLRGGCSKKDKEKIGIEQFIEEDILEIESELVVGKIC